MVGISSIIGRPFITCDYFQLLATINAFQVRESLGVAGVWGGNFAAGEAAKRAPDVDQAGEATQRYESVRSPTQISFQSQRSSLEPEPPLNIMLFHFSEDLGG